MIQGKTIPFGLMKDFNKVRVVMGKQWMTDAVRVSY